MNVPLLDRWRARLRRGASPPDTPTASERITIDLHATLARDYAAELPAAEAATTRVLSATDGADLAPLARRSPALSGYDWHDYLRCSLTRLVRVQRALQTQGVGGGRILDYGSYFGNFSLALSAAGHQMVAVDSYAEYGAALDPCVTTLRSAGVRVRDFADTGFDLAMLTEDGFDAVLCMGVIEHVPHTPRHLLDAVTRVLTPGGLLILDTPNLGYLYKRLALVEGSSIFCPIAQQYYTQLPFEGHHREYTIAEVEWMLREAGLEILTLETFNYSVYGQTELVGEHAEYYGVMEADPSLREVILAAARRPRD